MPEFNFVLLYVADVERSAKFYRDLLGCEPIEASPTFAMFPLRPEVMLGLWKQDGVQPVPSNRPGASEIAFTLPDRSAVEALHAAWGKRGIAILQPPTAMDFGHTFVGVDPDGHRLRAFASAAP